MSIPPVSFLGDMVDQDGQVLIGRLILVLHITKTELATGSHSKGSL